MKILKLFASIVIAVILALTIWYFALVPISIHSGAFIFGIAAFMAIVGVIYYYLTLRDDDDKTTYFTLIITFIVPIVIVILLILVMFFNSVVFRAKDYASLIEVEEGDFSQDIPGVMDTDIMDIETAQNIGARVMGDIDDVSQYVISDEYNMITYQGKTYRVSPLEYASKIKALGNEGITGYVLVDCKTQEATLVKLDEKIKYAPSAVFGYDLTRHIRISYPSAILGKYQFEIDEDGNPYYIVPTYKTTIGLFSGKVLDKVLVVNAITGQITEYGTTDIPDWIEHVDSIEHLASLATDYYLYQNGFLNSLTSQKDVKKLSYNYSSSEENFKGYSSIKTNNGIEYFTGLTSANNDESILGFLYLNPKTGTITFYECVGAEESSAMSSAEALVQNYGYEASYPFVVNVDGIETYLIALKDKTGTNKAYSLVNVKNYTISTQASTKEQALSQYQSLLNSTSTIDTTTDDSSNLVISSKITSIYEVVEEGTTYYYYTLEGYDDSLFVSSILNNRKQVQLNIGDTINIEVTYSNNYYIVDSIEF